MKDRLDTEIQDSDMLDEIALCASLMIAASESTTPLAQNAIDRVLGYARIA